MINLRLKQRFVDRARALSKEPEIFRSTLMTALITELVGLGVPAEAEYFEAAYGDPAGRDYWKAHLSEPMRVGAFAYLLSVHLPLKPEQLEATKIAITLALRDAAAAGERLFVGDISPLLALENPECDFSVLINVKARPRAAVDWLLSKPKREHLVPDSLVVLWTANPRCLLGRGFLQGRVLSVSSRSLLIGRKRRGGGLRLRVLRQRPGGLTFAAARQYLRDAFHRAPDVVVKEGRPSKRAK